MEKRLLLAAILSFLIIALYPFILHRVSPPPEKGVKEVAKDEVAKKEAPSLKPEGKPLFIPERGGGKGISIDTPLYRAFVLDTGGIGSMVLKDYRVELGGDERVDMVSTGARGLYPLEIFKEGAPIRFSLLESKDGVLRFAGKVDGLEIEKVYRFSRDTYRIDMDLVVRNTSDREVRETISLGLFKSLKGIPNGRYAYGGPVVYGKEGIETEDVGKLTQKTYPQVRWVGVEDKYFLFALIPASKGMARVGKVDDETIFATLEIPISLPPGGSMDYKVFTYAGPKEVDILKAFGAGLEDTVNFGIFSFLAKPLLKVLKFFYRYVGNYGVAIILVTVIIKILFYPLTFQSLRSMKEMQKIQPQIAAIKEKYKNDKERMNRELMELYRRSKINPFGGCLPILLQIPVFIALYNVLLLSIELRHAPFALWIRDLSAKDPYYVTPILMGISMLIQQRMSPTAMDPQQAKLMLLMPVVFTFFFLNFPSGLVLYWLVNNILSIAQQYYIQKKV